MKNRLFLKIFMALIAALIYLMLFLYTNEDKNSRIESFSNQQLENLRIHYNLTTKYYKSHAYSTVEFVQENKEVIEILTKFIDASESVRRTYRARLYELLLEHYKKIQKQGVLQFHFLMPDSVTSFRMHKPSKFGDYLGDFKYSFKYVNETKKPMHGFERGRTSPGFRNVSPLFGKDNQHIGIVDISFAPEVLQQNLYESSKIYSNFIIKKSIFDLRKWTRNDMKNDYVVSIENDDYLKYAFKKDDKDDELRLLIEPHKDEIKSKMEQSETFSLYSVENGNATTITFLPIHNTQDKVIAYLIGYNNNPYIYDTLHDFYILNFTLIILILIIAAGIYKAIVYNRELKSEKNRFHKLSQYDTLTKLPNRFLFHEKLEQAVKKAKDEKSRFSLLFIDLDNFKNINDIHGHHLGDKLLSIIAKMIDGILDEKDIVARIGGDEFIIILEEDESNKSEKVANQVIKMFTHPIIVEDKVYHVGVSIGISLYPDDTTNKVDLLKYADVALYNAKDSGKNSLKFYMPEMSDSILNKVVIENDLREAIKNEEFIIYYQPQINAKSTKLTGMEALVRWQHPQRGLIMPGEFISIAENTGLIIEIDQLVMQSAMKQYKEWYEQGLNPGVLWINLSVKQIQREECLPKLKEMLEKIDFKASWLGLEVTESQIMTNTDTAIEILNQISELGIELAIDDFGTGYSSLSYLKKLPIDKLKIDKSFIDGLPNDEEDIGITNSIIALSKTLNMKVIAEGVETNEQKEFLINNGCENIQGYFYSKPLPAQDIQKQFL